MSPARLEMGRAEAKSGFGFNEAIRFSTAAKIGAEICMGDVFVEPGMPPVGSPQVCLQQFIARDTED